MINQGKLLTKLNPRYVEFLRAYFGWCLKIIKYQNVFNAILCATRAVLDWFQDSSAAAGQVQEYALRSFLFLMISMCVVYKTVCFFGVFFCHLLCRLSCRFCAAFFAAFLPTSLGLLFSTHYKSHTILSMQYKSLLHIFGGGVGGSVKVFLGQLAAVKNI
jgi:hypothetical protein